jgi:Tfp pilus assembly protein PilZ
VTDEEDWDRHLAFAVFRYNASRNDATGTSPYRALFGVDPFEFDACMGLELRLENEPQDVAKRLGEVHKQLYSKAMKSRAIAHKQCDRAVKECSYAVGDRVLVYHFPGLTECGRKLRVPWIGPYRISAKHSGVGYSAVSELDGKTARVHVNRLKAVPEGREIDASEPEQGLWPDVRRVLRGILSKRTIDGAVEYQVRKAGRKGFVWVASDDLPDVVVKAFEVSRGDESEA